jgi:hypothetical protein
MAEGTYAHPFFHGILLSASMTPPSARQNNRHASDSAFTAVRQQWPPKRGLLPQQLQMALGF